MIQHILFFLFISFTSNLFASDIFWEKNIEVKKIEMNKINAYLASSNKIDINTADKSELQKLTGVGPRKADAIIAYRNLHGSFKALGDLIKVKGISKKILANIIEKNKEILLNQPEIDST